MKKKIQISSHFFLTYFLNYVVCTVPVFPGPPRTTVSTASRSITLYYEVTDDDDISPILLIHMYALLRLRNKNRYE